MPDPNEKILQMIRQQLQRENPPDTEALYGRAARIDESVRDLSLRQFNAKYVLRVRREMKRSEEEPATEPKPKTPELTDGTRARVREVLLALAKDVAAADQAGLIDVWEDLDSYTDRVVSALTE